MSCYQFIAAERAQHSVALLCRVVGVARSAFYGWLHHRPSAHAQRDAALTEQIHAIHAGSHGTYGSPRIHAVLKRRGERVSRKRVARLMRTADRRGCAPRRFRVTTVADPTVPSADLVRRQFTAAAPDQCWFGDITYVRTWEGWLYLAVLVDAFSRKVVGWALANHLRTELPLAALRMALVTRRPAPGLIQHTDRGSQYVSAAYRTVLADHGVQPSVGRPGTCWDNAVAESFFATLKTELVYRHVWLSRQAARTAIFAFIEGWYNGQRLHSTIGYRSPVQVEEDYATRAAAA
jgi:transposase InsO family protein